MESGTIHLGIAFDFNYIRHFYALFASILDNNKGNKIKVHAIITGIEQEEQSKIKAYAIHNKAEIEFYEIDEAFVKRFVVSNHWSAAVYYRLFFPLIVPESISRILYLDTDMIVVGNLSELYNANLDGYAVGAVYDNWVRTAPQLGIDIEGNYFNSGMLLINIPAWKEQRISELTFEYLDKYPERIFYVDQDGLNAVLKDRWKKLPFRFNMLHSWIPEGMSVRQKEAFLRDKVVIHYTLDRPWKMLCRNPYRYLYHKYLKKSSFRKKTKYDDYSYKKLPQLLKIKMVELYFEFPLLQKIWKSQKKRVGAI